MSVYTAAPRLLALAAAISASSAWAAEPFSNDANRVAELEQRLLILERKLEIQTEESDKKAKDTPVVSAGDRGFGIKSAKGDYEIKFSAVAQADYRSFLSDDPVAGGATGKLQDGFVLRRIRPTISGNLSKLVAFRFTPELAGSGLGDAAGNSIVDAYVDLKFSPKASVRIGKQKGPVGIERLQSGSALPLIERGLTTELVPNRDIGVAVFGELANKTVNYSVGVFNGTADGRDVSVADDSGKELEGRIFLTPFKNDYSPLAGLGFGVSGTYGTKHSSQGNTANANNTLARYRSFGQQQIFGYETGVVAEGKHTRLAPQISFYKDSLGVVGDYVVSQQEVVRSTNQAKLKNDAYSITASYVLTGEDASFNGVTPGNNFTLNGEGWGALEAVARIGQLSIDDDAFVGSNALRFANPQTSASKAKNYVVGLNWYLNKNVKLSTNYSDTRFDGGANGGGAVVADRDAEKALFTRVQLSY